MRFKLVAAVLSVLALAACETPPDETATMTTGSNGSMSQPSSAGTGSVVTRSAPNGIVPGSLRDFVSVGDRVFFDFDEYTLRPDARETLQKQAIWLKQYPSVTVTVQGHTDERGTREYNLALGERRANAVKNYLVALGIDPRRIETISYGKEVPFDPRSTEEAWALNRRGVTVPDQNTLASATN